MPLSSWAVTTSPLTIATQSESSRKTETKPLGVKLDPVSGPFFARMDTCYATFRLCMMIQSVYDAAADDDGDCDDDGAGWKYHNWTAIQIAVAPMPTRRALSGMHPWLCGIQGHASDGCMQVHVEITQRRSKNHGRVRTIRCESLLSAGSCDDHVSVEQFHSTTPPIPSHSPTQDFNFFLLEIPTEIP